MDSIIINGLNDAQDIAVTSPASVLQVLAPPGSGKTKTLTSRVAYLIAHDGLDPRNIIVCTFTNKAAREMRGRVEQFLGKETSAKLKLGTFHSIARRLLAIHGHRIDISEKFGIADTSDSSAIIKRIIERLKLTINPSAARGQISKLKANGVTAEKHLAESQASLKPNGIHRELTQVYEEYENYLNTSNLLDYDDLLLRCTELLRRFPQCVEKIEAVLVDEFQDTNHVQYDLMNLFAQQRQAISIVGDPDQSIYGWRSAKIENLARMREHFPEAHVVNLEDNYRSSGCILLAAQKIIEQDRNRPQKCLAPTHSAGEPPTLRRLFTAIEEAQWIVSEIRRVSVLTGSLLIWNDFAVLLRSASQSRLVETELANAGIPYQMVGGLRFFDRLEVKLVLDYLRVVDNPDHSDAVKRIINVPSRGIGEVTLVNLLAEADGRKLSLWTVVLKMARGQMVPQTTISAQARKGIESFVHLILAARKRLKNEFEPSLANFIRWFVGKLGLQTYLQKKYPNKDEHSGRWSNVQELIAQAGEVSTEESLDSFDHAELDDFEDDPDQSQSNSQVFALEHFLINIALSVDTKEQSDSDNDEGRVTLSTVHAAKGLEWPVVFIPCAYQGSIPHSRSEDSDEERRLLYVAMTRAQALLYMSYTSKDSRGGVVELSPFLASSNVRCHLAKRGPTLTFNLTQEIAKILGRNVTETRTENGVASIQSLEDDQFHQVSEEGGGGCQDDDESGKDSNYGDNDVNLEILSNSRTTALKRRREDERSPYQPVKRANSVRVSTGFAVTNTVQQANNFLIVAGTHSTSFVSARTLPQQGKENQPCGSIQAKNLLKHHDAVVPKIMRGQSTLNGYIKTPATTQPSSANPPTISVRKSPPTVRRTDRWPLGGKGIHFTSNVMGQPDGSQSPSAAPPSAITAASRNTVGFPKRLGVRQNSNNGWSERMSRKSS